MPKVTVTWSWMRVWQLEWHSIQVTHSSQACDAQGIQWLGYVHGNLYGTVSRSHTQVKHMMPKDTGRGCLSDPVPGPAPVKAGGATGACVHEVQVPQHTRRWWCGWGRRWSNVPPGACCPCPRRRRRRGRSSRARWRRSQRLRVPVLCQTLRQETHRAKGARTRAEVLVAVVPTVGALL